MAVLRPRPHIFAFYDGRIEGRRLISQGKNWLDDGAYELGICSYAIVDAGEAVVYDTHISLDHARFIRRTLAEAGVEAITVVLSHWHADHIAGTAIFADCEIIAHRLTYDQLIANRDELEDGSPPIRPVILPTRLFDDNLRLRVGAFDVELRHADIHSSDGTVLLLARENLLFAGDTLEDPITYVVEPSRLAIHLASLRKMRTWQVDRILPNHGASEVIARGGYSADLIPATIRYLERLIAVTEPDDVPDLRTFAPEIFAGESVFYYPPYEQVHRQNVALLKGGLVAETAAS